jgi:hypothetical protein
MPTFYVLKSRKVLIEKLFAESLTLHKTTEILSEEERYIFRLDEPEEDEVYKVSIGDFEPEDPEGKELGLQIWWAASKYFESARGRVSVHLLSRSIDGEGAWRKRMEVTLVVLPSKLGDARYNAMQDSLRAVSAGLVFDLLSKSRVSLGLNTEASLSIRPASSELIMLSQLWSRLALAIAEIASQPSGTLRRTMIVQSSPYSTLIGRRDLNDLVRHGIDPRNPH